LYIAGYYILSLHKEENSSHSNHQISLYDYFIIKKPN
jgi:hypothetical protein